MSAASLFPGYVKREIPVERDSNLKKKSSPVAVGACEETTFPSSHVEGLCFEVYFHCFLFVLISELIWHLKLNILFSFI